MGSSLVLLAATPAPTGEARIPHLFCKKVILGPVTIPDLKEVHMSSHYSECFRGHYLRKAKQIWFVQAQVVHVCVLTNVSMRVCECVKLLLLVFF